MCLYTNWLDINDFTKQVGVSVTNSVCNVNVCCLAFLFLSKSFLVFTLDEDVDAGRIISFPVFDLLTILYLPILFDDAVKSTVGWSLLNNPRVNQDISLQ
jgi:hypothetical protein